MKYRIIILLLSCAAFAGISFGQGLPFNQCPPIGLSHSCAVLIVITDDGLTVLSDTTQGTYDGSDDTLIGVQNNSSKTIDSIRLSGGSNPIFGFDGDGICDSSITPHPAGCPFGPTGYEGPGITFNVLGSDSTLGIVVFNNRLAPGTSAYFGLESAIQTVCAPLSVSPLYQYSLPWSTSTYDHTSRTIRAKGCALTSAAMTVNYRATRQGTHFSTNPDDLNDWLNAHGGYNRTGGLYFPMVAVYARNNGIGLYYKVPTGSEDDFTVLNYLCSDDPVTLQVRGPHGTHYVLATGELSVPNATPISDFYINDPGYHNTTLAGYGNTYTGVRAFSNLSSGDPSALVIQAFSPVQLLITDPQGNRVGSDPVTGKKYTEVANGGCITEQIGDDDNPDPNAPPEPENLSCEFSPPLTGNYNVQVIGTGSGPYTLDFVSFDPSGNKITKTFTGTAITNVTTNYKLSYTSTSNAIGIVAQCTGDVNADGAVNSLDLQSIQSSFGLRQGQTGFDPAKDLNRDGVIDIRDLAVVSRNLGCTAQTK